MKDQRIPMAAGEEDLLIVMAGFALRFDDQKSELAGVSARVRSVIAIACV